MPSTTNLRVGSGRGRADSARSQSFELQMLWANQLVCVVDDDPHVRAAIEELLASADLCCIGFASAREFIAYPRPDVPSCLILDLELPDINGLELQRQLGEDSRPPIIFITGHGSIADSVRAIRAGALDFLTKPVQGQRLLTLVGAALAEDRERRARQAVLTRLKRRLESLTPREREVLPLVVSGLLNKQAAAHLGISEVTLQIHRTNVMRKMEAGSLAELVRMAGTLEIPIEHSRYG